MKTNKAVEALNDLVVINNDRIEGYEKAAENTDERELKTLFNEFADTSRHIREELIMEVRNMGGTPVEGTKTSGKFFRKWMDVKAALTGNDRKAILNSCKQGEEQAIETYKEVLTDHSEHLTAELRSMINMQFATIHSDHERIKSMSSTLEEA